MYIYIYIYIICKNATNNEQEFGCFKKIESGMIQIRNYFSF